jgi:hypothetical protein
VADAFLLHMPPYVPCALKHSTLHKSSREPTLVGVAKPQLFVSKWHVGHLSGVGRWIEFVCCEVVHPLVTSAYLPYTLQSGGSIEVFGDTQLVNFRRLGRRCMAVADLTVEATRMETLMRIPPV